MSIKSGQAIVVLFATSNPTTSAAADASSTPTGTLYVNGTANGATVTVTNISTGLYKAAVTLPTLSAGDIASLEVAATVATIAGKGVVWQDVVDTKRVSELVDASVSTLESRLSAARAGYLDSLNGNVAQTGDSYARIGAAGAGLTALPYNPSWDAEIQSEAADALAAYNAATAANVAAAVVGLSTFNPATNTVANVTTVGSVTDRTGYSLSTAGIKAIWDQLTSALTTAGSIGKLFVDNINAAIGSRMATFSYTAPPSVSDIADGVWDESLAAHATAGSAGKAVADTLADTNELQIDWANNGRLDVILDGRASQASVDDVPNNAEFEARTVVAASYITEAQVNAQLVDVLRADLIPDSYSADGAQPTIAQAILEIRQLLFEKAIAGVTMTVYKPDGTTPAFSLTLNDATNPTAITRAS